MNGDKLIYGKTTFRLAHFGVYLALSLFIAIYRWSLCYLIFQVVLAVFVHLLVLFCFRFFSHLIMDCLHDFGLCLIHKFVDFLLKFALIDKIIVILRGKISLLNDFYFFLLIYGIFRFIKATWVIIGYDWLNLYLFDVIGNMRIDGFATFDHVLYLIFKLSSRWVSICST